MQVSDPPPSAPPLPNSDVFNVFRILGDVSHTVSICILIWAIHSNKSAEGMIVLFFLFTLLLVHIPRTEIPLSEIRPPCLVFTMRMIMMMITSFVANTCPSHSRRLIDNPSPLFRRLRIPLPRPILDMAHPISMELHPQELLHFVGAVHHYSHDESICAHEGEGESVENGHLCCGGEFAGCAVCHDVVSGEEILGVFRGSWCLV